MRFLILFQYWNWIPWCIPFFLLPGGSDGKSVSLQCGTPVLDPWVGKIPWRRKWQPTPVLLPGKSHGWRNLVGYSPWGCKELDTTEWLNLTCVMVLFCFLFLFFFPSMGVWTSNDIYNFKGWKISKKGYFATHKSKFKFHSINEVLLGHSHAHLSRHIFGYFRTTIAQVTSWDRAHKD